MSEQEWLAWAAENDPSERARVAFLAGWSAAVEAAQDSLVRQDSFSERTLRILDELMPKPVDLGTVEVMWPARTRSSMSRSCASGTS